MHPPEISSMHMCPRFGKMSPKNAPLLYRSPARNLKGEFVSITLSRTGGMDCLSGPRGLELRTPPVPVCRDTAQVSMMESSFFHPEIVCFFAERLVPAGHPVPRPSSMSRRLSSLALMSSLVNPRHPVFVFVFVCVRCVAEQATKIATAMVTQYGMSDKVGKVYMQDHQKEGPEMRAKVDSEVRVGKKTVQYVFSNFLLHDCGRHRR